MPRLSRKLPELIAGDCPFKPLPEQVVTWSISKKRAFDRCLRKFFWKYNYGLSPKYTETFFMVGNLFHEGVAMWYLNGGKNMVGIARRLIAKALKDLQANGFQDPNDVEKDVKALEGMLIGYSRIYKGDIQAYKIAKNQVEMWFRVSCDGFDFKGKVDMVAANRSAVNIVFEHKALSRMEDSYIDTLPMDTEARGFLYGLRYGTDLNPKRVIYNIVKKSKLKGRKNETRAELAKRISDGYINEPDKYFHREELRYSMADLATFEQDLYSTHEEYMWRMSEDGARTDPTLWRCNDAECKAFGKTCPYLVLCTEGLNRGTAKLFTQYVPKDRREK